MANPRHDKFWYLAALAFGLLVLPVLVHLTGLSVFGPYAGGSTGSFLVDYLKSLAMLRWYSWVLLLGPLAIVALWRGLGRLTARTGRPA